jgi:hypothetical protein
MSRYAERWLEIARQQYLDLPERLRVLVDRRVAQLLENPTADADAVHDEGSGQWSVPLGDDGFLLYAVVHAPATVIVLRLVVLG